MIPKIIHQIWIGGNFPQEYKQYQNILQEVYNDYKFIFWNENNMSACKFPIINYINGNYKASFKSDLLRYWILYKYGGIYFDTDFEVLKKIPDDFLNYNILICKFPTTYLEFGTGFIATEKESKYMHYINTNIIKNAKSFENINNANLNYVSGPTYITKLLLELNIQSDNTAKIFDSKYFYPYSWNEMHRKKEAFSITSPYAYAVHHWAYSWG